MKRRDFFQRTLLAYTLSVLPVVAKSEVAAGSAAQGLADTPGVKLSGAATLIPAAATRQLGSRLRGHLVTAGRR